MAASGSECESDVELMGMNSIGRAGRRGWRWLKSRSINPSRSHLPLEGAAPRDRGYLVYLCMLMGGAGFLFPWSSYIIGIDYFFSLYWKDFHQVSVIIPMTYMVTTSIFTAVNVSIVNSISLHVRIGLGYALFLLALLVVPLLDVLVHACLLSTNVSFYLTVSSVVIVGIGSGVQQSSYYGLAGMLPRRYAQAVMAGESVAGLVVSLNRIITKASTSSERSGALAFFIISFLFILVCVGCQMYIKSSRFVKYYVHVAHCGEKRKNSEEHEAITDSKEEEEEKDRGERESEEDREESSKKLERMSIVDSDQAMLLDNPPAQTTLWNKLQSGVRVRLLIMRQIWKLIVAVFSSFLITLVVFPGLVSEVQFCRIGDWAPVILVTAFNASSFTTTWLTLIRVGWTPTWLLVASLLRATLILPILLLVAPSPSQPLIQPTPFAWGLVLVVLLGLSNGYIGSLPMILFSGEIRQPEHRELAGTLMTLFLLLGLMVGSILAYALTPLTTLRDYTDCYNHTALFNFCAENSTGI